MSSQNVRPSRDRGIIMTDETKRLVRTAFQVVVSLAIAMPLIVAATGWSSTAPIIAAVLSVSLGITRVMAIPAVEKLLPGWLRRE